MFSLFIPNENYFYNDTNEELIKKEICFVCWLPGEKDNIVKRLSDFPHINIACKCKPIIHKLCIDDWISKSSSCPICRTKINSNSKQKYSIYYIKFVKITIYTLKFIMYLYCLNFMCMYFHSIYIFIFFGDDTDIY